MRTFSGSRVSIRTKLLLVALAVLAIPLMGYEYVREMKQFILKGQEDALLLTARAVSTVLHDRPELFRPETGVPELIGEDRDLYAHPLPKPIRLDGHAGDWTEQLAQRRHYEDTRRFACTATFLPASLSFEFLIPISVVIVKLFYSKHILFKFAIRRLASCIALRPHRRENYCFSNGLIHNKSEESFR